MVGDDRPSGEDDEHQANHRERTDRYTPSPEPGDEDRDGDQQRRAQESVLLGLGREAGHRRAVPDQ